MEDIHELTLQHLASLVLGHIADLIEIDAYGIGLVLLDLGFSLGHGVENLPIHEKGPVVITEGRVGE